MKPIKLSKNRNPTNGKQYEKPVESDEKPVEFYQRVLFSNEESGSCCRAAVNNRELQYPVKVEFRIYSSIQCEEDELQYKDC